MGCRCGHEERPTHDGTVAPSDAALTSPVPSPQTEQVRKSSPTRFGDENAPPGGALRQALALKNRQSYKQNTKTSTILAGLFGNVDAMDDEQEEERGYMNAHTPRARSPASDHSCSPEGSPTLTEKRSNLNIRNQLPAALRHDIDMRSKVGNAQSVRSEISRRSGGTSDRSGSFVGSTRNTILQLFGTIDAKDDEEPEEKGYINAQSVPNSPAASPRLGATRAPTRSPTQTMDEWHSPTHVQHHEQHHPCSPQPTASGHSPSSSSPKLSPRISPREQRVSAYSNRSASSRGSLLMGVFGGVDAIDDEAEEERGYMNAHTPRSHKTTTQRESLDGDLVI